MRIAVIGGGAAGMMAAATATSFGADVVLIEKNAILGQKVIISGGGRCNVTTGNADIKKILKCYPRGERFLSFAMHEFSPQKVYAWFEDHDVKLKVEKDLRVFPVSNDGKDIVNVFKKIFAEKNCELVLRKKVQSIKKKDSSDGKFVVTFEDGTNSEFDKLIITTGGQAYRHTGSTGDGYAFAESLGHKITSLAPSLNSFILFEEWPKALAGVSIKKAKFKVQREAKYEIVGDFMFTHKGITGPGVFALSSQVAFEKYDKNKPLDISVDFCPEQNQEELLASLKNLAVQHPKKSIHNTISQFVPKSLASVFCKISQINEQKNNGEISKNDWQKIIILLKILNLQAIGRGVGDEFVTAGGVDLSEVDQKTMESKIVSGLYFAGEILNIDGYTGGYNLQAAWCTGYVAGRCVS